MQFTIKDMDIATGGPLIVLLHAADAHELDLHHGDRILLRDGKCEIRCILDISHNNKAVPRGTIGLFDETMERLCTKKGKIDVDFAGKPESLKHIRDKLYGKTLTYPELLHIMDDMVHDRLSEVEKAYFVSAGLSHGWTIPEIVAMTQAMVATGDKLNFAGMVLDKHCIGGIPGNRTTMVVIPILAAAGFTMAKTSSRAITSPAGTADTMECLANVNLSTKKIKQIVKKVGSCIVHGGALNLAPADDKIISVSRSISIDEPGKMLASVMAKKYSVGSTHVLIDIPVGPQAKATKKEAKGLKTRFIKIGKKLGMQVRVILTDGSQPIGNGIGPALEARDVMAVLSNDGPVDLREKSLSMAAVLLHMTGKYSKKAAQQTALEILSSGKALKKMQDIIKAQGRQQACIGKYEYAVCSSVTGKISAISNTRIAKLARIAGAPLDKGAGLYLHHKVGDAVNRRGALYTIYAQNQTKLDLAKAYAKEFPAITCSK